MKVSATIDKELVRWVDGQVKERRFRNRSHALEWALANAVKGEIGRRGAG